MNAYAVFAKAFMKWTEVDVVARAADCLRVNKGNFATYINRREPGARTLDAHIRRALDHAYELGRREGRKANAIKTLDTLKTVLGASTDTDLAARLGAKSGSIAQWRNGYANLPRSQITKALEKVGSLKVEALLEFQPVSPTKKGSGWSIAKEDRLRETIEKRLKNRKGVYIMFDSGAKPIYVGRTNDQDLLTRIKQSFGRKLQWYFFLQSSPTSVHRWRNPQLGESTSFISAYSFDGEHTIRNIEALLIRVQAHSLANGRIENFRN